MSIVLKPTFWRGVKDFCQAWQISNSSIRLTVMKVGGHLAAISDDGDNQLNPLWQPHWESADASKIPYDGTQSLKRGWIMSKKFGGDSEAALLAGIVGHNLCVDRFGGPHLRMVKQGMLMKEKPEWKPQHGEAGVLPWTLSKVEDQSIQISVELPEAKLHITRTFKMDGRSVDLTTKVVPTDGVEKNIEWAEHVTFGGEFLDGGVINAPVDGAWVFPEKIESTRFPELSPLAEVDPGKVLAIPQKDDESCGDVATTRVTEGWFEVTNNNRKLTYQWDKETFPWLCVWTEHNNRKDLPWDGVERTKGLEFSSKPFPENEPPEERKTTYQGKPTTCVIPSKGRETTVKITWE